ncbi:hypothetical protein YC2023_048604 [Brassica napus]
MAILADEEVSVHGCRLVGCGWRKGSWIQTDHLLHYAKLEIKIMSLIPKIAVNKEKATLCNLHCFKIPINKTYILNSKSYVFLKDELSDHPRYVNLKV